MSLLFLILLLSSYVSPIIAYNCEYKFYNVSSLTSNVDLVAQLSPPPYINATGTYYVYFNPCGIVNNVGGASQNASAWGNLPKVPGSNDVIFGSQDSRIQTSFADPQDPAEGMMQLYTGAGCQWGGVNSLMQTQVIYTCAPSTPDFLPIKGWYTGGSFPGSSSCYAFLTVPTPIACTLPKPELPCIFNIDNSTFDLSLLHGMDRLGHGVMDPNFSYYMNLCGPITHTTVSTNDPYATIVQFYDGAQSYHGTLATTKQPLEWQLINPTDATVGIRAISTLSDRACPQRTTTIDLLCDMSDNKTPLWYVDRPRRTMTIQESDACTFHITFKARNACPTQLPTPFNDMELMEQ